MSDRNRDSLSQSLSHVCLLRPKRLWGYSCFFRAGFETNFTVCSQTRHGSNVDYEIQCSQLISKIVKIQNQKIVKIPKIKIHRNFMWCAEISPDFWSGVQSLYTWFGGCMWGEGPFFVGTGFHRNICNIRQIEFDSNNIHVIWIENILLIEWITSIH